MLFCLAPFVLIENILANVSQVREDNVSPIEQVSYWIMFNDIYTWENNSLESGYYFLLKLKCIRRRCYITWSLLGLWCKTSTVPSQTPPQMLPSTQLTSTISFSVYHRLCFQFYTDLELTAIYILSLYHRTCLFLLLSIFLPCIVVSEFFVLSIYDL